MPSRFWRQEDDDALLIPCPVCPAPPGAWCTYTAGGPRVGLPTQRLHTQRTQAMWLARPTMPKKHRMTPALVAIEEFERAEQRQLRAWLRQYVHLLL